MRQQLSLRRNAPGCAFIRLAACALILLPSLAAQAPSDPDNKQRLEDTKEIAAVMDATIRKGKSIRPDGVVVTIPIPPSAAAIAAIRTLGNRAVPALEDYLWSQNDQESDLAMRFLGAIGTPKTVKALAKVVRDHPSAGRRKMALLWLSGAQWDLALPVLKDVMEHDPDPKVRMQAAEIMASHKSPQ